MKSFCDQIQPTLLHYGAIKGLDSLKEYETVIQLGKLELASKDLLLLARAFETYDSAREIRLVQMRRPQLSAF